jgi:hypothetical protein
MIRTNKSKNPLFFLLKKSILGGKEVEESGSQ